MTIHIHAGFTSSFVQFNLKILPFFQHNNCFKIHRHFFPFQAVLKTSSETRSKLQMYSDDLRDGLDRWRSSAAADVSARCDSIDAADGKIREEIKAARHRESKYFKVRECWVA